MVDAASLPLFKILQSSNFCVIRSGIRIQYYIVIVHSLVHKRLDYTMKHMNRRAWQQYIKRWCHCSWVHYIAFYTTRDQWIVSAPLFFAHMPLAAVTAWRQYTDKYCCCCPLSLVYSTHSCSKYLFCANAMKLPWGFIYCSNHSVSSWKQLPRSISEISKLFNDP